MSIPDPLVKIEDAVVQFSTPRGTIRAVDGVSLEVGKKEAVAVVGESGCGKTTLARAVLGLQPLAEGQISIDGKVVDEPKKGHAKQVGIVWQDPFASIEPLWRVRRILNEPFRLNGQDGDIEKLMDEVGLDRRLADRFPHELSGGQRQRVAIGRALALRPPLVICDEPTAALDLSIQAQILNLLKDIKDETGCSLLYISHDLLTVRYLSDRVAVMYMGQIVETGPTEEVFNYPKHPYTKILLDSAPTLEEIGSMPPAVTGEIPDPFQEFQGCKFASRCPLAIDECRAAKPGWYGDESHGALCIRPLNTRQVVESS